MDLGPEDNTVTLRSDMRNPAGGLLLAVRTVMHDEGACDPVTTVGSYLFRSA